VLLLSGDSYFIPQGAWVSYMRHIDEGWKEYCRGLMTVFVKRTNNSTMEEKVQCKNGHYALSLTSFRVIPYSYKLTRCWHPHKIICMVVACTQSDFDFFVLSNQSHSMVWNYKNTDPEFGNWQAKQLNSSLAQILHNFQGGLPTAVDNIFIAILNHLPPFF
jgi:hypothetical protein